MNRRFSTKDGSIMIKPSDNGKSVVIGFDNEDVSEPHWQEVEFVTARLVALSILQITNDAQAREEEKLRSAQIERSSLISEQ